MTRRVAARILARAARHGRCADALVRWAPGRFAVRLAVLDTKWRVLSLLASALGWRLADPGGLELAARDVLAGAAVAKCESGHDWPADVIVEVITGSGGHAQPASICSDCALTLLDAGLLASARKGL